MTAPASHDRTILVLQLCAGAILFYLITVHSLASYLAERTPSAALRLSSNQPVALTRIAEKELTGFVGAASPESPATEEEQARLEGFARLPSLAMKNDNAPAADANPDKETDATKAMVSSTLERAILANPLSAQAIGLLGTLAVGTNDDARAHILMQAASERSSRIPIANYWLMRTNFEAKKYKEAILQANRLARTTPLNIALAMPYLGRMADASSDDVAEVLAENPPWRLKFFSALKGNIADPRTPLNLLLKLKETNTPPGPREFGPYVNLLLENGFLELAYGAWLQSLTPEQLTRVGFIYNGGFDYAPAVYPFPYEWSLPVGKGVIVETVAKDGGNNALMLKFGPGRAEFGPVSQVTMLMPGDYTLSAKHMGEVKSRRGLRWTISCVGKTPVKLAETDLITGPFATWTGIALNFSVPAEGCRAQQVKLHLDTRSASDALVSGSLYVDDVAIIRQGEPHEGG